MVRARFQLAPNSDAMPASAASLTAVFGLALKVRKSWITAGLRVPASRLKQLGALAHASRRCFGDVDQIVELCIVSEWQRWAIGFIIRSGRCRFTGCPRSTLPLRRADPPVPLAWARSSRLRGLAKQPLRGWRNSRCRGGFRDSVGTGRLSQTLPPSADWSVALLPEAPGCGLRGIELRRLHWWRWCRGCRLMGFGACCGPCGLCRHSRRLKRGFVGRPPGRSDWTLAGAGAGESSSLGISLPIARAASRTTRRRASSHGCDRLRSFRIRHACCWGRKSTGCGW